MKNLLQQMTLQWQHILFKEVLPFGATLIAVEQLVHLGSFTLEVLVFVAGWQVSRMILKGLNGNR